MKKTLLFAAVCFSAALASAQTIMNEVRVDLPVDTKVGNVTLPAGPYSIIELSNSVVEIKSADRQGVNAFAEVMPIVAQKAEDHTNVTLRKNENDVQLDKIWVAGTDIGLELTSAGE